MKQYAMLFVALLATLNSNATPLEGLDAFMRNDIATAERELLPAAESGNDTAQVILAKIYLSKTTLNSPEAQKAVKYLNRAIAAGNNEAKTILGTKFLLGNRVDRDITKGTALLLDAAEHSYVPAIVYAGTYYKNGVYFEQDNAKALAMFERGAALNDIGSMLELAEAYGEGKWAPRDNFKAVHYLLKASASNNPNALFILGDVYENGKYGIKKDIKQASRWYQMSADKGDFAAIQTLVRLGINKKADK